MKGEMGTEVGGRSRADGKQHDGFYGRERVVGGGISKEGSDISQGEGL